jgi:hypothetical protein
VDDPNWGSRIAALKSLVPGGGSGHWHAH